MKIYKIGNLYAVLVRTQQGGFIEYKKTRLECIEWGINKIRETLTTSGNLLIV